MNMNNLDNVDDDIAAIRQASGGDPFKANELITGYGEFLHSEIDKKGKYVDKVRNIAFLITATILTLNFFGPPLTLSVFLTSAAGITFSALSCGLSLQKFAKSERISARYWIKEFAR